MDKSRGLQARTVFAMALASLFLVTLAQPVRAAEEMPSCSEPDDITNTWSPSPNVIYHCQLFGGYITWVPEIETAAIGLVYNGPTNRIYVTSALTPDLLLPIVADGSVQVYKQNGNLNPQPAGELRIKLKIQQWSQGWVDCDTTLYETVGVTTAQIHMKENINSALNACGSGTFRTVARGQANLAGAWQGGPVETGGCYRSSPEAKRWEFVRCPH
jgi:hypothetical protein